VVSKDGALQLLLIIDHIFDWARDVYRSAIRRHLRFLSEPDTTDAMSMTHDSDIFSTNRPAPSSIGSQLGFEDFGIDDGESEELSDELRPMRLLDSPQGVLRDAALVEYKFLSFTITGDNTRTILQSFLPAQATKFARGVLSWLGFRGGLMVVDTETLDYLENMWTGELRQTKPLAAQKSFHTRVNFKTWLTNEWVIVKELSCLAISNDAIDVLMESANRMRRPCLDSHVATKDHLIDLFQPFKKCSPDHNLRAAAMRLALSSYAILTVIQDRFRRKGRQNADWLAVKQRHIDKMMEAESPNLFMLLEEVKGDPTHLLVDEIYRKHKIGRREPTESYIRISVSIDSQTLDESAKDYPHPMPGDTCLDRQSKYVLVAGSCLHRSLWTTNSPEVCLFIRTRQKHKDKDLDQLRHLVGRALEICLKQDRNILSTSRYGPSKPFSSLTWNLKDTVSTGMGQHRPRIRQWLYRLREEHGPIGISRFLPNGGPDSPVEDGKGMSGFDEKPADSAGPRTPNRRSPKAARTTEAFPNDPSSLRYRVRLISGRWVDQ